MNGFLKIDKEPGLSSFDVVRLVRKISKVKKVGHSGTLDPFASGLLVLGLGSYTKKLGDLLGSCKSYEGLIKFGVQTDTYDKTGQVIRVQNTDHLTMEDILEKSMAFQGKIMQKPPAFSAKKINGKRAYKLARGGQEVVLAAQEKEISVFKLFDFIQGPDAQVSFNITCSSGTYIRSIAHDLGADLGVGAHLCSLRRTGIRDFRVDGAIESKWLQDQLTEMQSHHLALEAIQLALSRV